MSASRVSIRVSILASKKAWWSVKCPVNASSNAAILARIRPRASCANALGLVCPPTSAAIISRPETPKMSLATTDSLIWASSSSFSTRCFSAVRAPTRSIRYRVTSRNRRISGAGTKLRRIICRSATLHNHTASSLSVLGRPGRCLTSLAFTNQGSNPWASNR
jgi:hypothetical protein